MRTCPPNLSTCALLITVREPLWFQELAIRRISLVVSLAGPETVLKPIKGKARNCWSLVIEAGKPRDVKSNPSVFGIRLFRNREYEERNSPTSFGENRAVPPITAVWVRSDSLPPTVRKSVPL